MPGATPTPSLSPLPADGDRRAGGTAAFELSAPYAPDGDQPGAIDRLVRGLEEGRNAQTLLGVTGSGKTFTMANVIARTGRPALVISHNKTLAAQLYAEFREFFPKNAVHYFVSYYDYYQPEAYIPQKDIYIEKDADINEDIDRLRLAATSALLARDDVIVVASVSCIYGLGTPADYRAMVLPLRTGHDVPRDAVLRRLVELQYERNDTALSRGKFRVRGDTVEIYPAYAETAIKVRFWGDTVERIVEINPVTGTDLFQYDDYTVYPAKHFVTPQDKMVAAIEGIHAELAQRLGELRGAGRLLEAQRLEARTRYDLELLQEVGYCKGIENYSRHLSGRKPGERPACLIDYFPKNFLCFVDESHVMAPQIQGMYNGDRARKTVLVEHGFRLPSALDNRPLRFEEWESMVGQTIFVSATPAPYELARSGGAPVEQIIRPTGLTDPVILVRPAEGQVPDLIREIEIRAARKERALVTTLTKRLAEDLAEYLEERGVKAKYLHSEIQTFERVRLLKELREGKHDCLVGVNLLREGLDLPEVTLVAILDADKEGFLRSETSIIQTIGRAARNTEGQVILYADRMTPSLERATSESRRRRDRQIAWNTEHGITPRTISKAIQEGIEGEVRARSLARALVGLSEKEYEAGEAILDLEREMLAAAERLEFEKAAQLRDAIRHLQEKTQKIRDAGGTDVEAVSSGRRAPATPKRRRGSK
ncbi:MAG: excinuclease ABC subunit UvrB [Candidatus Brocadiae bacterium]|nr:excinuclease ABC subunit UvrB [Candidatus Brocadiia bacterium]